MNIQRIKRLSKKPSLYEKGTAVMWTDPYISKKLLELHIDPDHDLASRSREKIEKITHWILKLAKKPGMNILDLGCGPGLYTERFALQGHTVTGVDFSENSIRYAVQRANKMKLNIKYLHQNYLELDVDGQFDLAVMIYLDFCVLLPVERSQVLQNIFKALKKGGLFIFDVVNEKNLDKKIILPSWEVQESGFWKSTPYIVLNNGYHYPEARTWANHHIVIGENDTMDSYIFWNHYYEKKDLVPILESVGFKDIRNHENVLPPGEDYWNGENVTFYTLKKA